MTDYASKKWLRPTPSMLRRLCRLLADTFLLAVFLFAFAWAISRAEAATLTLLPNSMQSLTMSECEAATGQRPRHVISKQDRTGEPWHHRTCIQ